MDKPTIFIITNDNAPSSDWIKTVRHALSAAFTLIMHHDRETYMAQLIKERACLILIDSDRIDWQHWATSPKINNATRRIPIVLVVPDADTQIALEVDARLAGVDHIVTTGISATQVRDLAHTWARRLSDAEIVQLDCDCADPLPPLALEGIAQFNAGDYYQQHDSFEALWVATESPVRDLYRAILQVGVGYYQIQRGNYRGALKMLQRSVQWLLVLPDVCQGVDVAQLRADSFAVRTELERLGEDGFDQFDHTLIKDVVMRDNGA